MPTTQQIIPGDCIEGMRTLPDASVHCCVTSPPYWGLRQYLPDGVRLKEDAPAEVLKELEGSIQEGMCIVNIYRKSEIPEHLQKWFEPAEIGLEDTPEAYVARMVEVFREVRRVLRDDGTCWINLGDSYTHNTEKHPPQNGKDPKMATCNRARASESTGIRKTNATGLPAKNLVGIPWRVAFALQADGWWLRQDIIWHKTNPLPESVTDRCTKAHEYVFLMTKSDRYFYDAEAVSEASKTFGRQGRGDALQPKAQAIAATGFRKDPGLKDNFDRPTRNRRSVWTISTKPYSGAHFAVMPADLVEPCIKAGCPEGGTVLDPFAGSGTTLAVAAELGRSGIGCELNPEYIALAKKRIREARESVALFDGIP